MSDPIIKKTCFVLSPIGEDKSTERTAADKVLKHLIKKSIGDLYDVSRADDDSNPGAISPRMIASILKADLVVADLSGHNPNVFYELAVAHGYRKPTVHLLKVGERIPFDVKDMRIVRYDISDPDHLENAQKTLRSYATFAEDKPQEIETPLSVGAEFEAVQTSTDPATESNRLVLDAIESLRNEIRQTSRPVLRRSSAPRPPSDPQIQTDRSRLMLIVDRVARAGRVEDDDFSGVVNDSTSVEFDSWVKQHVSKIWATDPDDVDLTEFVWDVESDGSDDLEA